MASESLQAKLPSLIGVVGIWRDDQGELQKVLGPQDY